MVYNRRTGMHADLVASIVLRLVERRVSPADSVFAEFLTDDHLSHAKRHSNWNRDALELKLELFDGITDFIRGDN